MSDRTARPPVKLGVLISGEGTNLQAMIDAVSLGELRADMRVVISNKASAKGLDRARRHGIRAEVIDYRKFGSREDFDSALVAALRTNEVELVACAGFMRLLSPVMIRAFPQRIMNIHPALCPAFPGVDAQKAAIDYGVRFSGCTVFFVTEGIDDGPVIVQAVVPVYPADDEARLAQRIHAEEHRIYPYAIRLFQEGRLEVQGRKVLIKDFPAIANAQWPDQSRVIEIAETVKLDVVVPMLNEARDLAATLIALRKGAPDAQIIVVDGGSTDQSVAIARPLCNTLIATSAGRAHQMNAGAAASQGDVIVFVHADTRVPTNFVDAIAAALDDRAVVGGRFDVELDDRAPRYRMVGTMISRRSRLMRSATGDQAIFVRRAVFDQLGGFAAIALCEDVDFFRRLRGVGRVACLRTRVITSARRWQRDGVTRTILRMWAIKSLFLLGVSPDFLKRHYVDAR